MKIIIFTLLMISLNASAMTMDQARSKITEITQKQKKTNKDITDLKEAINVLSNSWAKRQN